MDGIPTLMQQNKRIESLCREVENGDLSVVARLCTEWHVHDRLDHDFLYQALPATVTGRDLFVARAQADQRLISRLIRQIEGYRATGEQYTTKSGLLVRLIREHVTAEELTVVPFLLFDTGTSAPSVEPHSQPVSWKDMS